jgi:hypothetical protein
MLALIIPFCFMFLLSAGVMFAGAHDANIVFPSVTSYECEASTGTLRYDRIYETQYPPTIWSCHDHHKQRGFYFSVIEERGSFSHPPSWECKQVYP